VLKFEVVRLICVNASVHKSYPHQWAHPLRGCRCRNANADRAYLDVDAQPRTYAHRVIVNETARTSRTPPPRFMSSDFQLIVGIREAASGAGRLNMSSVSSHFSSPFKFFIPCVRSFKVVVSEFEKKSIGSSRMLKPP
jgi:hypothetical protein